MTVHKCLKEKEIQQLQIDVAVLKSNMKKLEECVESINQKIDKGFDKITNKINYATYALIGFLVGVAGFLVKIIYFGGA